MEMKMPISVSFILIMDVRDLFNAFLCCLNSVQSYAIRSVN
jgi:hypothetical protein